MNGKIERIKTHIKDHKEAYVTGTVCFVAGALVAGTTYQINYKSPGATNVFIEAPKRLGHPGYIIRDTTTGMVYASQNAAAKTLGLNPNEIKKNWMGLVPDVHGHVFENLGEAIA